MPPRNTSLEPLFNLRISPLDGYMATDQFTSAATSYFGFLHKNGSWFIQRQVVTGDNIAWRYATGSSGYVAAWAGRTLLNYNYANVAF